MQSYGAHRLAQHAVIVLASLVPFAAHSQADAGAGAAGECRRLQSAVERLNCYDRVFPPVVETGAAAPQASSPPVSTQPQREPSVAPSREPGAAAPNERTVVSANRAQIVEVAMPSVTTTVLVAADGRVFTRESTTVVVRWPATPFDVNIETSRLGNSTFLIHPRTGERVRVAVRD